MNLHLPSVMRAMNRGSNDAHALISVFNYRHSVPVTQYPALLRAFKRYAPRHAPLVGRKLRSYGDVFWIPPPTPLSFDKEVQWAPHWLAARVRELTAHAERVKQANECFEAGELNELLKIAADSVRADGWSFWAASLKLAAASVCLTTTEFKDASLELQNAGSDRISGLLARMITDRNDTSVRFNSFETRFKEFLERVDSIERRSLFRYCVLCEAESTDDLARILAFQGTSSFVDYYEAVIYSLGAVFQESEAKSLWASAEASRLELIQSGVLDYRLHALALECPDVLPSAGPRMSSEGGAISSRCVGIGVAEPAKPLVGLVHATHQRLSTIEKDGLGAFDDVDELMRLGAKFQSLPVGRSMTLKAWQQFLPVTEQPLFMRGAEVGLTSPVPEQLLMQDDDIIASRLRAMRIDRAEAMVRLLDADSTSYEVVPDAFDIWLARSLIVRGHYEAALKIVDGLQAQAGVWSRYATKLKVYLHAKRGDLNGALMLCARAIVQDHRLAYELPISELFDKSRWAIFSGMQSWLVAYVAHFANSVRANSNQRFYCRMACRKFYKEKQSRGGDPFAGSGNDQDREIIADFLRVAWIEENLSLVEEMNSTQDVRRDRLQTYQFLLSAGVGHEEEYQKLIQELTLDETLWSGLREIDSNRVFVNEAAISRWADKELSGEFDRWKVMQDSLGGADLANDQALRTYLVDQDVEALLRHVPAEQQSEAGALVLNIVNRLFHRFLTDPADGLNCYLSIRVRHGTLRGVLLGEIEEASLLLSGAYGEEEFLKQWSAVVALPPEQLAILVGMLQRFSAKLDELASWLVKEKVQIQGASKPEGVFTTQLDPSAAQGIMGFTDSSISFAFFLNQCYLLFWGLLAPARKRISDYFLEVVSSQVQAEFQALIDAVSNEFEESAIRPLVAALQSLSTKSAASCKTIAEWFLPVVPGQGQVFPVHSAVGIARQATSNIYRGFQPEMRTTISSGDINLSTSGLAILYDCLFVMFGNAWKHSGLGSNLADISVDVVFHAEHQVLHVVVANALSDERRCELLDGELDDLQRKYLGELPVELVAIEGGSGFPKLGRIARGVDRSLYGKPLDFEVTGDGLFKVGVMVQLYQREGAYDAYL